MKTIAYALAFVGMLTLTVTADISLPKKDNFYDKMGRGIANVAYAPAHLGDSIYTLNELEGGTVAFSKGFVQGISRMMMDMGLGVADILTAPFPTSPGKTYRTLKSPPYDSMVISEYPPGDLKNFW